MSDRSGGMAEGRRARDDRAERYVPCRALSVHVIPPEEDVVMRYRKLKRDVCRLREPTNWRGLAGLCVAVLMVVPAMLMVLNAGAAAVQVTEYYGDIMAEGSAWYGSSWDLTQGDMVITYELDMSEYVPPMWNTAWSSIGVGGGAWGWMASGAPDAAVTNPASQDIDDKLNLGAPDRYDESSYDIVGDEIVGAPIGDPWSNFGVWFDRDGVDQWQADNWGMIDGVTYNTGGVYDVMLTIHSLDGTVGTMFATVNGVQTGFYDAWKDAAPDYYPVGKTISGDLTTLTVFSSVWGAGVKAYDLTVTGYRPIFMDVKPNSEVDQVYLGANGNLPVAVFGTEYFDVSSIDTESVRLEGVAPDGVAPIQSSFCDVDNDGFLDAMYVFDLQELVDYGVEDELLSLSFSVDGEVFVLEDEVVFVGKPG